MRLKQIKLAGFKSFVDSTKIPFLNPLSAIIGPNGCGKSNIIDAVRWVLGESSAKHLRGDSMADVIFNGSTARRPVSVASVELNFENLDGRLTGEYSSYQEIVVKRQVSRDGDSSYFLNGQKCRRKDITDLFMGTGLGPRSYAIIEQGTISRLIESKPQELRVFIEEAAGISRYKERRRETENRIRHTRENLERLGDIRTELGRQLDKLAEQATAAKQYRELKQSERQLDSELFVSRYLELTDQTERLTLDVNRLELAKAEVEAEKERTELELTRLNVQLVELDGEEQKRVESFYLSGTQIAKLEQDLKHRQQQDSHVEQRIAGIVHKLKQHQDKLSADEISQQTLRIDLALKQPQLELAHLSLTRVTSNLSEHELKAGESRAKLSEHKEKVSSYRLAHEVSRGKLSHQGVMLEQTRTQLTKIEQEATGLLEQEAAKIEQDNISRLTQWHSDAMEQGEFNDEHDDKLSELLQAQINLKAKQEALGQSLAEERGRLALVTKLLPDDVSQEGTKALWQLIDVQPGWEKAVELIFDGLLKIPAGVDKGEFGFEGLVHQEWHGLSSNANLSPWLSQVQWADSLEQAKEWVGGISEHERIVTADGYLLGRGFVIKKGTDSGSLVQLKCEQEALEVSIDDSESLLNDLNRQGHDLDAHIKPLKIELSSGIETLQKLNVSIASLSVQIEADKQRNQERNRRREHLDSELARLKALLNELQEGELSIQARLNEAQSSLEQGEQAQTRLVQGLEERVDSVSVCKDKYKQLQQEDRELSQICQTLTTKLALNEQSIEQQGVRIEELTLAKSALEHQLIEQNVASEDGRLSTLKEQLGQALAQQQTKQVELASLRSQQTQLQESSDSAGIKKKQQLGKTENLTQSISTLKLRREGLKGQADSQLMQLKEQNIELEQVKSSLDLNKSAQTRQRELERIRAQIIHLGAINLAAIEEYEQQSERKNYLDSQDADLTSALTSLEEAIRKIDKETKSRFKDTFDKVNKDLGLLFPKVFGGGSAELALTHDDLLETGVTIMARPPGKKNSTIHLLSGGEKALTALSLVFAIFRLNPAPFCMLDEVDAPLDDANVDRFCRLVKEMSQSVQFIFISHNKITMELADQLIGVTMHEPGVSRIVAVDIDEAVALADAG
ncbi:chromosome segregation protein SMC [Shewanella psychropiezotolerans]|uniref:Chromosome partition protein Smc n=1 Tax=Shewanella psychropiezotolerans TaxID=2593655 RepID=A0ABX5X317_9GAMM|nr:chromosome segregation protein SMC [Shewanella psychropiezotolerans]QDO83661.1 chromosome segregation protein SMC [Shewanella psychropiezotolerans]